MTDNTTAKLLTEAAELLRQAMEIVNAIKPVNEQGKTIADHDEPKKGHFLFRIADRIEDAIRFVGEHEAAVKDKDNQGRE